MPENSLSIAVCGGGRAGTAIAADAALMGHSVTLYETRKMKGSVEAIMEQGGLELTGDTQSGKRGFAKLKNITTDPKQAIEGADIIFVAVPAFAHKVFFEAFVPHLKKGQKILVNTGYWASLRFASMIERRGILEDIVLAESNIMPYAADRISSTRTHIHARKRDFTLAAFPGKKTDEIWTVAKNLYPQYRRVPNVLWTNFSPGNTPMHATLAVPIAGLLERYRDLRFYFEATEVGARLMEAFDRERLAAAKKLGVRTTSEFEWVKETYGYDGKTIADALRKSDHADMWTPVEFIKALLLEDIPHFYVPLSQIGDQIGVPTPTTKAIIDILSVMFDVDYRKDATTLKTLGFKGLTARQIVKYVTTGEK